MMASLICKSKSTALECTVYNSVQEINQQDWEKVRRENQVYLSLPYLKALEESMSGEVDFRYLTFHHELYGTVAIASVQILNFKGVNNRSKDQLCFFSRMIKDQIAGNTGFRVMTCGNVFASGENGLAFTDDLPKNELLDAVSDGLMKLQKKEKSRLDASLILLKEFWPESQHYASVFKENKFIDFSADVNMIVRIHPEWHELSDYLASMQAKFRTKANAAFSRSKELECRQFSEQEIIAHADQIERLYLAVVHKSPYTFGELNSMAFANFKKALGKDFIFNAYFLQNELVCFSTAFVFGDILDANYVGINYKLNPHYQLYSRMLYDFVGQAISLKSRELRLGRTAEEMKSTIGAVPVDMKLYVRHANSLSNRLIKPIIGAITPRPYELRRPFRTDFAY